MNEGALGVLTDPHTAGPYMVHHEDTQTATTSPHILWARKPLE